MRKVAFAATLAALALGATQTASAEGWYAGAGLGQATIKGGGFKDDDIGFKIFGGYQFNPYIAAEVEYLDGGTAKDEGVKVGSNAFSASAIGSIPLNDQFSLFARLGYASWELNKDVDDDGEDLIYGLGAAFNVTPQVQIRAEYEAVDVNHGDFDYFGVSAAFKF
jgi:OOP family OmpA-OmpF porin